MDGDVKQSPDNLLVVAMRGVPMLGALSVVCLVGAWGLGWLLGGADTAWQALAGMGAALVGGWVSWVFVSMIEASGGPVMAVPMVGMMGRLVVTGLGVALLVRAAGMDARTLLFSAVFGYLALMACEVILLYRAASRRSDEASSSDDPDPTS